MKTTTGTILLSLDHDPYSRVKKKLLKDASISFTAKGIMAYLVGQRDGWRLRVADLVKQSTEKERAIRTALNELRAAGYVKYEPPKEIGAYGTWTIADSPMFSRHCCFSNGGDSHGENSHLSNNEISKKDVSKSKESEVTPSESRCILSNQKIEAQWKPDPRSKQEQLDSLQMPANYPDQREFDDWLEINTPGVANYRPDLYQQLCAAKWHKWNERANKWCRIRNWKAYVSALDTVIEDARTNY